MNYNHHLNFCVRILMFNFGIQDDYIINWINFKMLWIKLSPLMNSGR